jgi:hypothetical protein
MSKVKILPDGSLMNEENCLYMYMGEYVNGKPIIPDDVEDIIRGIIREKDFADYKTIDVVFKAICKDAIDGIASTKDVAKYCEDKARELSNNFLFEALVGYLNADLQTKLSAATASN